MKLKYLVLLFFVFPFVTSAKEIELPRTEQEFIIRHIASRAKEANISPVKLVSIAYCESRFKTNARNENSNSSVDFGIFQVNSLHWKQTRQMGLDLSQYDDSTSYAIYLIKNSKYDPYSASSKCWKDPKIMKHISSLIDS